MIATGSTPSSSPGEDAPEPPRRLLLLASEGEPWGLTATGAAEAAGYSVQRVSSPAELLRNLPPLHGAGAGRPPADRGEGRLPQPGVVLAVARALAAAEPAQRQRLDRRTAEAGLPVVVLAAEDERNGLGDLVDRSHVTVVDSPPSERVLSAVLRATLGERDRRLRLLDLQRRLEELRGAGRREERLLAKVGHELRNPLGAITTALSLLRELHDDDRSEHYFRLIERQVELLRLSVDDLLDMAGLSPAPHPGAQPGAFEPEPERTEPQNVPSDDGHRRADGATAGTAAREAAASPAGDEAAAELLVVEDDPDGGAALRDLLEMWGYGVQMARRGEDGIASALDHRPAVALVDIGLPDVDGYEVARRVRQRYPEAPPLLVAMTGYGQPEDRQRALEAGFDLHLVKPVRPDQLEDLLRERLAGGEDEDRDGGDGEAPAPRP